MKSFLVLFTLVIMWSSFSPIPEPISITEGIRTGVVKLNVTSLGGYSGECLTAIIKNNTTKPILIQVPAGLIFNPSDTTMQDILIVKNETVNILASSQIKVNLYGYCCQASNRSPTQGMQFKISPLRNDKLIKIAKFINSNIIETDNIQSAVWAISDNKSVSNIYDVDRGKVESLRAEVCRLTGQKNEWFSTDVNYEVDNQGYIRREPLLVSGLMELKNIKAGTKLKQEVCKDNGEVVWSPVKETDLGRGGTITYNFNLKVEGWKTGKYYVRATIGGKEVMKKEFEI